MCVKTLIKHFLQDLANSPNMVFSKGIFAVLQRIGYYPIQRPAVIIQKLSTKFMKGRKDIKFTLWKQMKCILLYHRDF